MIDDWVDGGGELWELIEPVDSLHPTQQAQGKIRGIFSNAKHFETFK